ncbi:MAG: RES domain-containing protein [Cyanobacteriota bacterium]|jgi:hypothetical protein
MAPFRLGFRVCDRRYPFLWSQPGQPGGRWNRPDDPPRHYLASSPLVAWAEWLRHQEIHDPEDLEGVAAALWAVLLPPNWGPETLPLVDLPETVVLSDEAGAQEQRRVAITRLQRQGAQGLQAPTAALIERQSHPCRRCGDGLEEPAALGEPPLVFVLWCPAETLLGWSCVQEGHPWPDLLPLVRRLGGAPGLRLAQSGAGDRA